MNFTTMHPADLVDSWRTDGPKIDGVSVKSMRGEAVFKAGPRRLVAFKRCGAWRWGRRDVTSRAKRKTGRAESFPLESMDQLGDLVRGLVEAG